MTRIERTDTESLALYASVSIAYTVETVLQVSLVEDGLGGMRMVERKSESPYTKDYDAGGMNGPERWAERFDLRYWGIFLAWELGEPVGGAAVATMTPELGSTEENRLAVLWDIRVRPGCRGRSVGGQLLRHAAEWAAEQNCRRMMAETQNTNVPACRFYRGQGFRLGSIHRFGYDEGSAVVDPSVAGETMLLWYRDL